MHRALRRWDQLRFEVDRQRIHMTEQGHAEFDLCNLFAALAAQFIT
jgi:hypothetical protein